MEYNELDLNSKFIYHEFAMFLCCYKSILNILLIKILFTFNYIILLRSAGVTIVTVIIIYICVYKYIHILLNLYNRKECLLCFIISRSKRRVMALVSRENIDKTCPILRLLYYSSI